MKIEVLRPGLLTTVQDLGREGFRSSGVPPAGAMDPWAARAANLLVGNPEGAAALEITLEGPELRFSAESSIAALTGSHFAAALDGRLVPFWTPFNVPPGSTLDIRRGHGARCYLAVSGGIDVPIVLGSRSTSLRGEFGGYQGRSLRRGDLLSVGERRGRRIPPSTMTPLPAPPVKGCAELRALVGAQSDLFAPASLATFFSELFRVSVRCDRTGIRLEGPRLMHLSSTEIRTEGVLCGGIQVPGSGEPVILGPDQPVTGGYPKIAQVIQADLGKLAYLLPGDTVRFRLVALAEAREALREREEDFRFLTAG